MFDITRLMTPQNYTAKYTREKRSKSSFKVVLGFEKIVLLNYLKIAAQKIVTGESKYLQSLI